MRVGESAVCDVNSGHGHRGGAALGRRWDRGALETLGPDGRGRGGEADETRSAAGGLRREQHRRRRDEAGGRRRGPPRVSSGGRCYPLTHRYMHVPGAGAPARQHPLNPPELPPPLKGGAGLSTFESCEFCPDGRRARHARAAALCRDEAPRAPQVRHLGRSAPCPSERPRRVSCIGYPGAGMQYLGTGWR